MEWQLPGYSRHYNYLCLLYHNRQLMKRTRARDHVDPLCPSQALPRLIHQINRRNIECHQAYCSNKRHNYWARPKRAASNYAMQIVPQFMAHAAHERKTLNGTHTIISVYIYCTAAQRDAIKHDACHKYARELTIANHKLYILHV